MIKSIYSQAHLYLLCLQKFAGGYVLIPIEIFGLIMVFFYRSTRIKIKSGWNHSCVLIGELAYSFGFNSHGELGLGDTSIRYSPQLIDLPRINKITCGPIVTLALTTGRDIYAWGNIEKSEKFGTENVSWCVAKPFKLSISNVKKIRHNKYNFILVTKNNEIHINYKKYILPDIKKIKCESHVMVLTTSGEIYSYGANESGQLGLGHTYDRSILSDINFGKVGSISNYVNIDCGWAHTIALTLDNKLYVWGRNACGQLGLGDTNNRNIPHQLILTDELELESNIMSINCGMDQTFILMHTNYIYVCGYNVHGSLGSGGDYYVHTPLKLSFGIKIDHICSSKNHTIFRAIDDTLYGCGSNDVGQLGLKDYNEDYRVPTKLCF